MNIASIGIDLGKATFHLVALGERNKILLRRKFSRSQLMAAVALDELNPTSGERTQRTCPTRPTMQACSPTRPRPIRNPMARRIQLLDAMAAPTSFRSSRSQRTNSTVIAKVTRLVDVPISANLSRFLPVSPHSGK